MKELDSEQRAYLAGFLDGEGNINIAGKIVEGKPKGWTLVVSLYNCDLGVLETIRGWVGSGCLLARKRSSKWRTNYVLKWRAKTASEILASIYPYLIIKKRQAEIAIEFSKTVYPHNTIGSSWKKNRRLKPDIVEKRVCLKKELQSLTGIANYGGDNSLKVIN